MSAPSIKGWCPGAYRPMLSGDGLIVRVRPRLGRLTRTQVLGICQISQDFGNGIIDLTSRANLQIRGLNEDTYTSTLDGLATLGLLDDDPELERRRNILTTPNWQDGDLTTRLHAELCTRLADLPAMPAKMGFAIDAGPGPVLGTASADFRVERGAETALIMRLDGLRGGRGVSEASAIDALIEMAEWFSASGGANAGRMARHVVDVTPPSTWSAQLPAPDGPQMCPGTMVRGVVLGAPFGVLDASALAALVRDSHATVLRCTPWRMFVLEGAQPCDTHGFITDAGDPLLAVHACPGAPACASATVDTRALARALASLQQDGLHVSGCTKGCAHPRAAGTTLVGRDGAYDLVKDGHSWDQPRQRGLTTQDVMTLLD